MGVDISIVNPRTNAVTRDERFATVWGFFNVAQMAGVALPAARAIPLPWYWKLFNTGPARVFRWYDRYTSDGREQALTLFERYCEFIRNSKSVMEQQGIPADQLGMFDVDAADYEEDVRIYLAKTFLSEKPIGGQALVNHVLFLRILSGAMKGAAAQFRTERPELADAFDSATVSVDIMRELCEEASSNGHEVHVSP